MAIHGQTPTNPFMESVARDSGRILDEVYGRSAMDSLRESADILRGHYTAGYIASEPTRTPTQDIGDQVRSLYDGAIREVVFPVQSEGTADTIHQIITYIRQLGLEEAQFVLTLGQRNWEALSFYGQGDMRAQSRERGEGSYYGLPVKREVGQSDSRVILRTSRRSRVRAAWDSQWLTSSTLLSTSSPQTNTYANNVDLDSMSTDELDKLSMKILQELNKRRTNANTNQ